MFKIERCRVVVPQGVPLLAGAAGHRYFFKLSRECTSAEPAELNIESRPPAQWYIKSEWETAERMTLTVSERTGGMRRLGAVRLPIAADFAPLQVRLEVPEIGLLDFIPSNQEARVYLGFSAAKWPERLALRARPGFYQVVTAGPIPTLRGEPGVSGNISLRLSYQPREVAEFTGASVPESASLAVFDTEGVFPVRDINLPVPLLSAKDSSTKVAEVVCGKPGAEHAIEFGSLVRIPYQERDSCRILLHRDRIPASSGRQRLRVVTGDFNQIIVLEPGGGTLTVTVPASEKAEYDTVTVLVAHDMLSGHYTMRSGQTLGEEVRFRILLSDSWLRVGATTAMPAGIFRFGSGYGAVPISAGILARASYIQADGRDFPLGLESGLFVTNLSGEPDLSLVLGLGFSIPVLNTNSSLQATFGIVAWLEYVPTRTGDGETPFSFLFGPSITFGRLSTTF